MNKIPPRLFCVNKPVGMTSYDVIRKIKRLIPKSWGKIGHFGTLDPFAEGLLIVGVAGAARLNDYIHSQGTKVYTATGVMGVQTNTGDKMGEIVQKDEGIYLEKEISRFEKKFIQEQLEQNLLGSYLQAPPAFSAAKFQGKPLHQWAREGVEIKKESKQRWVHQIEVLDYQFPKLVIRFEVSSGTYIRTLFEDSMKLFGTLGHLEELKRERIGKLNLSMAMEFDELEDISVMDFFERGISPQKALEFQSLVLDERESKLFSNGVKLSKELGNALFWVESSSRLLGLAQVENAQLSSLINFPSFES